MAKKDANPEEKQDAEEIKSEEQEQEELKQEEPEQEEESQEPQVRYKQFWKGDISQYAKELENAYANSSEEGLKLNSAKTELEQKQAILTELIKNDPDLKNKVAEKLYGTGYEDDLYNDEGQINKTAMAELIRGIIREEVPKTVTEVPAIKKLSEEQQAESRKIFHEFSTRFPEVETDPNLKDEFKDAFAILINSAKRRNVEIDLKETLYRAYKNVTGKEVSMDKKEEIGKEDIKKVIQKDSGSMGSPSPSATSGKEGSTRQLTPAEKSLAEAMGLTDEDYLEGLKLSEEAEKKKYY